MTSITLQIPSDLLAQAQVLAGSPDHLQSFLISAIEQEILRHHPTPQPTKFWTNLEQLRYQLTIEGIEINPDEIWGETKDTSIGREIEL